MIIVFGLLKVTCLPHTYHQYISITAPPSLVMGTASSWPRHTMEIEAGRKGCANDTNRTWPELSSCLWGSNTARNVLLPCVIRLVRLLD